ncbi:MAG: hypothetical protein IIZ70_02390 [Kiritimatiellae bacterium]|jgi:hypothetical protein|nr:hypothetical protein [Kiritimatiellia bacterium]
MATRRGQALVELAIGMFVVALVLSGLLAFGKYIVESLDEQRTMRADAGQGALGSVGGDGSYSSASRHASVTVSPLAAEYIFGSTTVEVKEEVHIPVTGISNGL